MWSVFVLLCLAALSVLPTYTSAQNQGAFDCNGTLSNPDAREKVLNYHNEQRKLVADGDMHNKAGYIPQAGNMEKMIYDCELESKAEAEITSCPTTDKFAGLTTAYNYEKMAEGKAPLDAATTWVTTYTDGSVAWPRKNILTATQLGNRKFPKFGKMINANATAVGCAYKDCTFNAAKEAIILCVYDAAPLAEGIQLYKTGDACLYCPSLCEDSLCVRQPDTTTPVPTTAPTTAPTAAPTTATTAAGGSTGCSPDQSQDVRNRALDMINYRRSELAKGAVAKDNGALLPAAANMRKIVYDCALEGEAMAYAKQCTGAGSSQLGITENFERVSAADQLKAVAVATRTWWKQVRLQPGIGVNKVTFRDKHMSSPIRFFTLMGWADVQRMGCGAYNCGNLFNVVCRYTPRGNIVNNVVYVKGSPASQCPSGTRPDSTYPALCA